MKSEFEKLNEIYTSITDIDRILRTSDNKDKLDNVFNAIKNINRSELDQQIINDLVVRGIRNALVKIYNETLAEINKNVYIDPRSVPISGESVSAIDTNDYYPNNVALYSEYNPLLNHQIPPVGAHINVADAMTMVGKTFSPVKRMDRDKR